MAGSVADYNKMLDGLLDGSSSVARSSKLLFYSLDVSVATDAAGKKVHLSDTEFEKKINALSEVSAKRAAYIAKKRMSSFLSPGNSRDIGVTGKSANNLFVGQMQSGKTPVYFVYEGDRSFGNYSIRFGSKPNFHFNTSFVSSEENKMYKTSSRTSNRNHAATGSITSNVMSWIIARKIKPTSKRRARRGAGDHDRGSGYFNTRPRKDMLFGILHSIQKHGTKRRFDYVSEYVNRDAYRDGRKLLLDAADADMYVENLLVDYVNSKSAFVGARTITD